MSTDLTTALQRYCAYWQNLTADNVADIKNIAPENFAFTDPFHQLSTRAGFITMLQQTLARYAQLQFVVHTQKLAGAEATITWTCRAERRVCGLPLKLQIDGGSTVLFDTTTGQALSHVDHWQPWRELLVKPALRAVGLMPKA